MVRIAYSLRGVATDDLGIMPSVDVFFVFNAKLSSKQLHH